MNVPTRTMSAIYPLRLRTDLPRDVAREYWANQHAEKVKRLPNLVEYNQYHAVEQRMGIVPLDIDRYSLRSDNQHDGRRVRLRL